MRTRLFTMDELRTISEALSQYVENSEEGDTEVETHALNPRLALVEKLMDEMDHESIRRVGAL